MPSPALNSIDDYEHFLWATLEAWSPEQRLALAAAMAEHWLPANLRLRISRTRIGARYHWGLKRGKDLEGWGHGKGGTDDEHKDEP